MKKNVFGKSVVVGIIVLFIGASVGTSISVDTSTFENIIKLDYDECYYYVEVDNTASSDWYNVDNHTDNIQDAIDLVCENGTVFVHNGLYQTPKQSIIIDKPLNLKGENKTNTIITGTVTSDCIIVTTWYVNISSFNLTAGGPSSWLAAIKIIIPESNKTTVNIFDNIMFRNHNGIYVALDEMKGGNTSVNIYKNEIFNNVNDGIILVSDNNIVRDNNIHDNGDGGIDIWSSEYNTIEFNIIYNNSHQGIWHDDGQRNKIGYNTIENNGMNGIIFFTEKKETFRSYSTYNKIYNNIIKSNGGGILLYHSNDNMFYNNTIELNIDYGLKIQYISSSRNYKDDINNGPTSKGNEIYNNNFINNGKPFFERYVNAVESWPTFDSINHWNRIKPIYGNYWKDSVEYYDENGFNRNGTWDEKYRIPLSFFGIRLDFLSENFDDYPWCRKNGWVVDKTPEKPSLVMKGIVGTNITIDLGNTIYFITSSTDINDDRIAYGFNWSATCNDSISNLTVDGEWLNNNKDFFNSGEKVEELHQFLKKGSFQIRVKVKDYCSLDKKSDGNSSWSDPISVTVN
jgi:parallel beta-helix repeat protein